jgi:hypothetical protein
MLVLLSICLSLLPPIYPLSCSLILSLSLFVEVEEQVSSIMLRKSLSPSHVNNSLVRLTELRLNIVLLYGLSWWKVKMQISKGVKCKGQNPEEKLVWSFQLSVPNRIMWMAHIPPSNTLRILTTMRFFFNGNWPYWNTDHSCD